MALPDGPNVRSLNRDVAATSNADLGVVVYIPTDVLSS